GEPDGAGGAPALEREEGQPEAVEGVAAAGPVDGEDDDEGDAPEEVEGGEGAAEGALGDSGSAELVDGALEVVAVGLDEVVGGGRDLDEQAGGEHVADQADGGEAGAVGERDGQLEGDAAVVEGVDERADGAGDHDREEQEDEGAAEGPEQGDAREGEDHPEDDRGDLPHDAAAVDDELAGASSRSASTRSSS